MARSGREATALPGANFDVPVAALHGIGQKKLGLAVRCVLLIAAWRRSAGTSRARSWRPTSLLRAVHMDDQDCPARGALLASWRLVAAVCGARLRPRGRTLAAPRTPVAVRAQHAALPVDRP